jgi:ubiquitin C-terminal hydrolase
MLVQEMSMTKDAAIHIVFTLQGLHTWTHSNRSQPEINQLNNETPAVN